MLWWPAGVLLLRQTVPIVPITEIKEALVTRVLLGIFREPDTVATAMRALRAADFPGRDLTVLAASPIPRAVRRRPGAASPVCVPFVGAACGFAVGLLLTIGTQLAYPMVTGGKPLLSIPPMLIVLFEATLLGAWC